MSYIATIQDWISETWGKEPQARFCTAIISFACKTPSEQLAVLTYRDFADACDTSEVNSELVEAVSFLSGAKIHAFDAGFFFVDEDDEEHEIGKKVMMKALETGEFFHPNTGERVENFENYIYPFFSASEEFCRRRDE